MKREEISRQIGLKAENFFSSKMSALGLPFKHCSSGIDDTGWYDFNVCDERVEVKSCGISVKQGKRFRSGRFDFTDENNRQKQYAANIWVCFIARAADQFIMLGFCRAKQLEKKRYITLSNFRNLRLLSLDDWVKQVNI